MRHFLGDLLLTTGKAEEAESVYREDLSYWVKNGFALNGLYHSLLLQNKQEEADTVKAMFDTAWKRADLALKYSRIDEAKRKDLAIRLRESLPADLVFLAGTLCSN